VLQISRSNSRIVERVDVQIGPTILGFAEGADPAAPHTLVWKKADHSEIVESITLADLKQLGQEILDYVARVTKNNTPPVEPPTGEGSRT
jgi:hypothetical protein